jgi:hypothetical protein
MEQILNNTDFFGRIDDKRGGFLPSMDRLN